MDIFRKNQKLFLAGILTVVTAACFWQVTACDFINFDDYDYLYENKTIQRGLTFDNIIWAFTTMDLSNWHPLTWISYMIDCQVAGLNPAFHHSVNLMLHILNTLLLFLILQRCTSSPGKSFYVALLFAIHPLHVESVAWIAERKDVLSVFWGLSALLAYVFYTEKPSGMRLAAAVLLYAAGIMSKPMLVSFPFILLLFDYWPLRRFPQGKLNFKFLYSPLMKEKFPFFVLAAASCLVTLIAQYKANTILGLAASPLDLRVANAFVSYVMYLAKTLWPVDLAILYPYPDHVPYLYSIPAFVFIIFVTAVSIRKARDYPYVFVGWAWYIITLIPVIGFIRVGAQSMADRYTYLPLIGIFIIVSWLIPDLVKNRLPRQALPALACVPIIILCPLTWKQTGYWKNSISVYEHALAVTENNFVILTNMGVAKFEKGEYAQALDQLNRALAVNRKTPQAFYYTGHILSKQGKCPEAIPYFQSALALKPNYRNVHTEIGVCYFKTNRHSEAETHFREELKLDPGDIFANYHLANILISQGREEEARLCWERMLKTDPYSREANLNMGNVAALGGNLSLAVSYFQNATRAKGDSPEARYNLGIIHARKGELDQAAFQLDKALKLKPDYAKAHNNLGNVLLLQGKADEAISHFREALRIDPGYSLARQNLNDALALRQRRSN